MSVAPCVAFCFIGGEPLDQGAQKQGDRKLQAALPRPAELLATLVAFDTTSAKSNLKLIDFVRDTLASHGVTATLTPSPDGAKASLFATIGPANGNGGIGLSSHSDCVPVEGQTWASDPFTLTSRDGKLYGRGSCDMKGFLACRQTTLISQATSPGIAATSAASVSVARSRAYGDDRNSLLSISNAVS